MSDMKRCGLMVGKFDPLTPIHARVIREALHEFDIVFLFIFYDGNICSEIDLYNDFKSTFSLQDRVTLINRAFQNHQHRAKLRICRIRYSPYESVWMECLCRALSLLQSSKDFYLIGSHKNGSAGYEELVHAGYVKDVIYVHVTEDMLTETDRAVANLDPSQAESHAYQSPDEAFLNWDPSALAPSVYGMLTLPDNWDPY